ncbi:MAG: insulinase family protein [Armatimonadetes bacterium]|nr:insulinase family protein [Armatimonadota bacterium]
MRVRRYCAVLAVAAWALRWAGPGWAAILDGQRVSDATLPNGLHVIVLEEPQWGVVGVGLNVRCGSLHDPPDKSGLSHLVEHLLFESADPAAPGLGVAVEDLGGYINAQTLRDFMSVDVLVASSELEAVFQMLADRVTKPSFDEEALRREKQIVAREISDRSEEADAAAMTALWELAYPQHPYGRPIGGSKKSLAQVELEDLVAHHKRFYVPNNSALVVVGDVEAGRVFEAAKRTFGGWRRAEVDWQPPAPEPPLDEVRTKVVESGSAAVVFAVGFPAPGIDRPGDVCAMDLIYAWFNEGEGSWLQRVLVNERKLALAADAEFLTQRYPGLLILLVVCAREKELEARQAILEAVEQLRSAPLSDEEMKRLKDLIYTQYAFTNETCLDKAGSIGFYEMITGYRFAFDYIDLVEKVTPEQLQEVARRYLNPDAYSAVVLRPRSEGGQEALAPALRHSQNAQSLRSEGGQGAWAPWL